MKSRSQDKTERACSGNFTMESQGRQQDKIRINVSGTVFVCYKKTLKVFEDSLLAKLDQSADNFDHVTQEFFFDRDARMFGYILDAYRKGTVHLPRDTCGVNFRHELEFWGLSTRYVSPCCWKSLYGSDEDIKTVATLDDFYCKSTGVQLMTGQKISMMNRVWLFIWEPKSSIYAMLWACFISLVIMTSVMTSAVESLPSVYTHRYSAAEQRDMAMLHQLLGWQNTTETRHFFLHKIHPAIPAIECACFSILTLEMIVCAIVCPHRQQLLKCWLHCAEVVCTVCYWTSFFIETRLGQMGPTIVKIYMYLEYVSVLKIVRLVRVASNIPTLKIMGLTLKQSIRELSVMALLLFILSTSFGLLIYSVEVRTLDQKFENVFSAMYWVIITLTTVGYGNYTPTSPAGHVIACVCAVCGILMLAIPVGIIGSQYHTYYDHHKYAKQYMEANCNGSCSRKDIKTGNVKSINANMNSRHEKRLFNCNKKY